MKFVKKVLLALAVLLSAFAEGKLKPYDYEVEYLESTGTQYIYIPQVDLNMDVECKFKSKATNYEGAFGVYVYGRDLFCVQIYKGNIKWFQYNDQNGVSKSVVDNQSYPIVFSKIGSSVWFGGVKTDVDLKNYTPQPIFIFAFQGNNGVSYKSKCVIYYLKIGGYDLIPVVKSNEGMMYDRVSGQLFRNAGTGAFVVGPRKADSAVEIAMGEMEVRE